MPLRTGVVSLTLIAEHACRLLAKYQAAIETVLDQAVTSGLITSAQKAQVDAFIAAANGACAILKIVTGY